MFLCLLAMFVSCFGVLLRLFMLANIMVMGGLMMRSASRPPAAARVSRWTSMQPPAAAAVGPDLVDRNQ